MRSFTFLLFLLFNLSIQAQTNQYLHFDGIDDYASVENGIALLDGANEITMAGWFYTDQLIYGGGMMGFRGGGDGDSMYLIQLSDGVLESRVIINGTMYQVVGPAGTMQAETWQHVAWVYNGSTVELFIDGISKGSSSASGGTFHGTTKPFGIGKNITNAGNFMYKGRIDELTLWDIALTQTQIQDSMSNEFVGNESGLIAYYKFNQGIPGDDNTFITTLLTETGNPLANADLHNFALTGSTSNFGGVLEPDFQVINFPTIGNKVISDPPFNLEAYTSSGLEVNYTVVSGPASVVGSLVTIDGTPGEVVIQASQPGDGTYNAAEDVFSTFHVLDPALTLPEVELLNPTQGDVMVPVLGAIPIAAMASIEFPDLFSVDDLDILINSEMVTLTDHGNGRYTGWWTPSAYGTYDVEITGTNNYGYSNLVTIPINIINTASNTQVAAATDVWLNGDIFTQDVEVTLPSYMGAFDNILGTLIIECPTGGCDPWDRVSHVQLQGHDGIWHEIIRYITPYGVACDHEIDMTDFMSLLQGTVKFRFTLGTSGNGFLYSLNLDYQAGAPTYNYSRVEGLWDDTYAFGDMANLQPVEGCEITYSENVETARIKLVSTGHGWGDLNTGNAAEFHHDIHNIWVDGVSTFEQDNWLVCNPNPNGCQPQNGTWYFDRAGWCPGSIAPWFDFDFTSIDTGTPMNLNYVFDEDYVDFCHPNNPDCITGVTCSNCNAGFNPHLIVDTHLISYGNNPIQPNQILLSDNEYEDLITNNNLSFSVFPNPSSGKFILDTYKKGPNKISIYDMNGHLIKQQINNDYNESYVIDISFATKGIYFVKVSNKNGTTTKKILKK